MSSLHDAVKHNDCETLAALLVDGADVDARDGRAGRTPLHLAAQKNLVETAKVLLSEHANVHVTTNWSKMTPLHYAADKDSLDVAMLLVEAGADVNAADREGRTPLHCAAMSNSDLVAAFLLEQGAYIEATDKGGRTPLHLVARNSQAEVACVLLKRGANIETSSSLGRTPLHDAAANCRLRFGRVLLEEGAQVDALDREGNSPLRCLAVKALSDDRALEDELRLAYHLLSAGSPWSSKDEQLIRRLARQNNREVQVSGLLAAIRGWMKQRRNGMTRLTRLPLEVYRRGGADIRVYFKSIVTSPTSQQQAALFDSFTHSRANGFAWTIPSPPPAQQPRLRYEVSEDQAAVFRKKLCVIGPSKWGKTSFAKTLTTHRATLESTEDRTIGIDIFSWNFLAPPDEFNIERRYEVSIWDFAGQDEYQAAHSLFYSKRTMYLVCIDLEAYAEALNVAEVEEAGARSAAMDAFVENNVFRWIRVICAREPESEFVFVGTKSDLIGHDQQIIDKITTDLMTRINRKEEQVLQEMNRMITALRRSTRNELDQSDNGTKVLQRIRALEELRLKRPRFLAQDLVLMSSADLQGIDQVYARLERHVIESDTSFLMPEMYLKVAAFLRQQVALASHDLSSSSRVRGVFRGAEELSNLIENTFGFSGEEITAILHVLEDLGDILWFDESIEELAEVVFLSPTMVIDFVRQVINHNLADVPDEDKTAPHLLPLYEAVREEGRVAHELLCELDLWCEIFDDQLMLQLKQLLFHFQLAYPAGNGGIEWNSDLIVPIYWRKGALPTSLPSPDGIQEEYFTERVCWEYDFHRHLPPHIFEKLGVQSYSAHYSSHRLFSRSSFETRVEGKYSARVSKTERVTSPGSVYLEDWTGLSIEVEAPTREAAWQQLIWYSMNLEKILEDFPGLWVTRYTVAADSKRYEVDQLLTELGERYGSVSFDDALLPPRMDWYTKKAWTTGQSPSKRGQSMRRSPSATQETEMEMRFRSMLENQFQVVYDRIDVSTEKLLKQLAEIGNRRDYPALWTLEVENEKKFLGLTTTYILKIRSQLSGKCYHEPIEISVANSFFGKYGVLIKNGISLFASVTLGDFLAPAVDGIVSELATAVRVHNLADDLDLSSVGSVDMETDRTLSPDGTIVLLRELLMAYDSAFDPLKISTITGLECGIITATGEHVWAHRTEIQGATGIVFRHDYSVSHAGSGSVSIDDSIDRPSVQPISWKDQSEPEGESRLSGSTATIRIMGVENLMNVRHVGIQSPYCKWRLVNHFGRVRASGRTSPHEEGGTNPSWKAQTFIIELDEDLANLESCSLVFRVKTTRGWRLSDEIAVGSFTFRDVDTTELGSGKWQEYTTVMLHKRGEWAGTLRFHLRVELE